MPAASQTQDRSKALATALAQIDKSFGKGSVMRLGDESRPPVSVIPTGSVALDVALGVGGLPRGRIIEVYGPESSGKTTVALHAVASAQRAGGNAAFIDAEHALDPVYAKALGVDIDNLLVSQPDTGEQALEITDMLVRSGGLDIIVIDSVAALVPKAEIEGEMGDSHVGLQARLMSQALRKITGALSSTGTTAIFINQLREKIGVFFGNPETTTGGKALKFYASVRLDVRRIGGLKDGDQPVGNRTRVKVVKNKMAPPFKQAEFDILYGQGISREGSLLDLGVDNGVVRKSGAWFTYGEDQLGQGKENARNFLKDNPQLAAEIEEKILAALGIGEPGRKAREAEELAAAEAAVAAAAVPVDSADTAATSAVKNARGRGKKAATTAKASKSAKTPKEASADEPDTIFGESRRRGRSSCAASTAARLLALPWPSSSSARRWTPVWPPRSSTVWRRPESLTTPPTRPAWRAPASRRRGRPDGLSPRSCGARGWAREMSPRPSSRSAPRTRTWRRWHWPARSSPPPATCPGRCAGAAPPLCWGARATAGT